MRGRPMKANLFFQFHVRKWWEDELSRLCHGNIITTVTVR